MTYNVHRCLGYDGLCSPQRIARVIAQYQPDVIALQELDVGRPRSHLHDQPRVIAEHLEMLFFFHPAFEVAEERYGDAILSRHPMHLVRSGALPARPNCERRGALWVAIEWHGHTIHVLNTHLGLVTQERIAQIETLLGPEWLSDPRCEGPRIFCGDLNAWPGTRVYGRVKSVLQDVQGRLVLGWPRNTFPARLPVVRIDHIFHSAEFQVRCVRAPRTRLTRTASDHLPLIADLAFPAAKVQLET
jgi:endonuclease/exonuclease/phosphatase family metal-dependent hydrolase